MDLMILILFGCVDIAFRVNNINDPRTQKEIEDKIDNYNRSTGADIF